MITNEERIANLEASIKQLKEDFEELGQKYSELVIATETRVRGILLNIGSSLVEAGKPRVEPTNPLVNEVTGVRFRAVPSEDTLNDSTVVLVRISNAGEVYIVPVRSFTDLESQTCDPEYIKAKAVSIQHVTETMVATYLDKVESNYALVNVYYKFKEEGE